MPLPSEFYYEDTLKVAKNCIGKIVVHETENGILRGRIVEAEAYMGTKDKAAHANTGVPTKRTKVQFGQGGHAYERLRGREEKQSEREKNAFDRMLYLL